MRATARPVIVILILSTIAFLMGTVVDTPDVQAQADQVNSTSWAAIYYPNTDFVDPLWLISYIDEGLNLNFDLFPPLQPDPEPDPNLTAFPTIAGGPTATPFIVPLPGMPADGWSARISSEVPLNAGIYEFTIVADGGIRLIVNDEVIIDDIGRQGLNTYTGTAFVRSGLNEIVIEYVDYTGNAILELRWEDITEEFFGTTAGDGGTVSSAPPATATARVSAAVTGLALRSGPYLGASLVAVLRPGRDYQVVAQNNIEGEFTWYKLIVNEQGQTGWASSRYLDVNLGNITQSDCTVPTDGGLSIAQTIVPNFSDAAVSRSCFGNVAGVLNQSVGSSLSENQTSALINSCSAFSISANSTFDTIVAFVDSAKLVLDVYGICNNGSCSVGQDLALELAGLIQPGYSGTGLQALVCLNTLASILEGQINNGQIGALVNSCSQLIILPQVDPNTTGIINLNALYLDFIARIGNEICQTTSIPTLSVPEEVSIFNDLTLLPDTGVTVSPRATMNIRVRPSTRAPEAGSMPWGAQGQLIARTVQAGEDHWYMIRYNGIIGWIDASFANVRGNINDVPIY